MSAHKPSLFISYCHVDEEWKDRLAKHLRVFGSEFSLWDDREIQIGQEWRGAIERALAAASAAVLLVSIDFLDSPFVQGTEIPTLLRRRQQEGLRIFPVIVGPCPWKHVAWLAAVQARPKDGRPLGLHSRYEAEAALAAIAEEIGLLLRAAPPPSKPLEPQAVRQPVPLVELLPEREPAGGRSITRADARGMTPAGAAELDLPSLPGVTLQPFTFTTVKLNAQGEVVEQRELRAYEFSEDLGDGVALDMVALVGGEFAMGAGAYERWSRATEEPQHRVTIAACFLGKFAVTQAQWQAVATLPRVRRDLDPDPAHFKGTRRPVENVSWHDAQEFCARLKRRTGRRYRLPSEAEWEYAARGGSTTPFAFGPTITPAVVNYDGNHAYDLAAKGLNRAETVQVGALGIANAFGLFDMHGNVWEWTRDPWHGDYRRAPADQSAWTRGGEAARRVVRGGSWRQRAFHCRSSYRLRRRSSKKSTDTGFRVCCPGRALP